jgi:hypothetical protein
VTPATDRPSFDRHGDTPLEVARLQAAIMARLGPEHRTREMLRMSSALLRQRQVTLLEECHGDRDRMLERFVELHHGRAIAEGYAAHRRQWA